MQKSVCTTTKNQSGKVSTHQVNFLIGCNHPWSPTFSKSNLVETDALRPGKLQTAEQTAGELAAPPRTTAMRLPAKWKSEGQTSCAPRLFPARGAWASSVQMSAETHKAEKKKKKKPHRSSCQSDAVWKAPGGDGGNLQLNIRGNCWEAMKKNSF